VGAVTSVLLFVGSLVVRVVMIPAVVVLALVIVSPLLLVVLLLVMLVLLLWMAVVSGVAVKVDLKVGLGHFECWLGVDGSDGDGWRQNWY
jgi:hypothetical protein